jgi:flagellar basal-body rod modification protein FlgD
MQVTGTNPSTTAGATTKSASSVAAANTLDYHEFLQLLVAQLQNQDPTNPTDPSNFVSQLASFSAVEQQVNTNSTLDALLTQSTLDQAASFIGKTVTSADGSTSGTVASVQITSSGATATLTDGSTVPLGTGITIS